MKTRVYLTIDTECREERPLPAGLQPLAGYDARIWGRFVNQRRELGIRLLMHHFEAAGLRATFYLDPFSSLHFGAEGLAEIVGEIRQRGHDVQLHAHPVQRHPDWHSRDITPPSDDMADYSVEEQTALLEEGMDLLVAAGVPREDLVSFRAGNFGSNNDTWRAMAKAGLALSSNYNPCYADKGMKMHQAGPAEQLFDTQEGVWELPITTIREPSGAPRHLQITALSLLEMADALLQAHRSGASEVTIVTHSFEIYHLDEADPPRGRLNHINFFRLWGLCRFLAKNSHKFEVETTADLVRRLRAQDTTVATPVPLPLRGRRALRYLRFAEQAFKRIEKKLVVHSPFA
ncbi:MAG: hypothetical protein JRH20_12185 [Deltaproteobacteria bacterium]|nr:hypothetical protein [Deltaproteobacteria bacterium]